MQRQDLLLANLGRGVPNVRRHDMWESRVENHVEYEVGSELDFLDEMKNESKMKLATYYQRQMTH